MASNIISLKDRLAQIKGKQLQEPEAQIEGIVIDSAEVLSISYSSLEVLNTCPRKFELYKIHPMEMERDTSPALSLGSAVGVGYARYLELVAANDKPYQDILDDVLLETWRAYFPALEDNVRSISKAHVIVEKLIETPWAANGVDDPCDWELAYFNDKPAAELSFCIQLTDSLVYTGFLDGVMFSPSTGLYRPLELKTSSLANNLEVNFKNSAQGLAYALIIDKLSPTDPQYIFDVHYRVAQLHRTKAEAYRPTIHDFFFHKTLTDRLEWLIGLQLEVNKLGMYLESNLFPKRGSNCLSWNRPCPFYGVCNLTNNQSKPKSEKKEYQFYFRLDELITEALELVQKHI